MRGFSFNKLICAVTLLYSLPAYAIEYFYVRDAQGRSFAEIRFFSISDQEFDADANDTPLVSTWNLSAAQKELALNGVKYWANIIRVPSNGRQAIFNVGTMDEENAYAFSPTLTRFFYPATSLAQEQLQNGYYGERYYGAHVAIGIGKLKWNDAVKTSHVPMETGMNLSATLLHEVAHALGLGSTVQDSSTANGTYTPSFASHLNLWTKGLRDDNDNASKTGQDIWCTGCSNPAGSDYFDLRKDEGYFTGTNVDQVLAGGLKGVPVKILSPFGDVDSNYMSHSELKNSLMSHQNYRNYVTFMEAELAVMQDLGYDIDRRNLYGHSIYGSGLTINNHNGYFQRNSSGTAYMNNNYNTAELGLGLHIYGSNNRVTQLANLLSSGNGGGEIRVDGEGNALTVSSGTQVHANGAYGRGVMFTYGKNHTFIHHGDIQATGTHGIAASFDFGNNMLSNDNEYRGSYIYTVDGASKTILPELDGALVTRFDVAGKLTGRYASIYISDNAYVENINIMHGAVLSGDIISLYNQKASGNTQRLTNLSFGLQNEGSHVTPSLADNAFRIYFDDNIKGIDNFRLQLKGGETILNGHHSVYDVVISDKATLAGNSSYQLNSAGSFTNNGTLTVSGHNTVSINGNYTQSATGMLLVGVSGDSVLSTLTVSGSASLAGRLGIELVPSWFANGYRFTTDKWVTANSTSGSLHNLTIFQSSYTLNVTSDETLPNGQYGIIVTRAADAYASVARGEANATSVGSALDKIASNPHESLKPLLTAIDFSTPVGSYLSDAFQQLTPVVYSNMFTSSLLREHRITNTLANAWQGMDTNTNSSMTWEAFAVPFARTYYKNIDVGLTSTNVNDSTMGVVFGAERREGDHWKIGLHGALSSSSTTLEQSISGAGSGTAISGGLQARFEPNPYSGLYALGVARFGVEINKLNRTTIIGDYVGKVSGAWSNITTSMTAGGGWRWQTGQSSSIGAMAGVDYTMIKRPALTESGSAEALDIDPTTYNTLRMRLGGEWRSIVKMQSGHEFITNLQTSWNYGLLDTSIKQSARFKNNPEGSFSSTHEVMGANSIDVQGGMTYDVRPNIKLNGGLAATMWMGGGMEFSGAVSVNWQF
jgi:subtilase-type serine protease